MQIMESRVQETTPNVLPVAAVVVLVEPGAHTHVPSSCRSSFVRPQRSPFTEQIREPPIEVLAVVVVLHTHPVPARLGI